MNKSFKRGFTLIELLVVIAIIAILSEVVLSSLSSSRGKASIATFVSEMNSFKKTAEVYNDNSNGYTGLFTNPAAGVSIDPASADASVQDLLTALKTAASDGGIYGALSGDGSAYAIYGIVPGVASTDYSLASSTWCIDSTGFIGAPTADATDQYSGTAVTACW